MTTDAPPTVLLVDDEQSVVDVYALWLRDEFDVRTAYGGQEAIEKLDADVDVVLLDRRMPRVSGDDVLQEIRGRGLDVLVAMVTAVDPGMDVVDMDIDAYVVKPVFEDSLRQTVEQLVRRSGCGPEARELFSLIEKRALLEAEYSERQLEESDRFADILEREAALSDELGAEFDDEYYAPVSGTSSI